MARNSSSSAFGLRVVPFLALMAFGSWGLSQFLKMPTQIKDDVRRRKKTGLEKFDLNLENERLTAQLAERASTYENIRIPGPRPAGRKPAD